jgi:hypothetical protein
MSVAANVAHSFVPPPGASSEWSPHPGAVVGAVFWPLAVIFAVEILTRTRWPDGWRWVAARYLGLIPVALVAAVVSYRHMSGLLVFYGEDRVTSVIGPLAVDGLMVMATSALLATGSVPSRQSVDAPVPTVEPIVPARKRPVAPEHEAVPGVPNVLEAARRIAEELEAEGVALSRRRLAGRLRAVGHGLSTARAGVLLQEIKAGQ